MVVDLSANNRWLELECYHNASANWRVSRGVILRRAAEQRHSPNGQRGSIINSPAQVDIDNSTQMNCRYRIDTGISSHRVLCMSIDTVSISSAAACVLTVSIPRYILSPILEISGCLLIDSVFNVLLCKYVAILWPRFVGAQFLSFELWEVKVRGQLMKRTTNKSCPGEVDIRVSYTVDTWSILGRYPGKENQ